VTRLLDLEKHLAQYGCAAVREGGRHSVWQHLGSGARSTVPRHREIPRQTARAICRQLGVPPLD
jgi:predicted RNA binding protein YcfA (HicA-like mRNA interferase family)